MKIPDVSDFGPLDDLGQLACPCLLTYLKSDSIFVFEELLHCSNTVQIFFSFRHSEVTSENI